MDLSGTIHLKSQIQSLEIGIQVLTEELKRKKISKLLVKLHYKKYKEIKSTTESYNHITKTNIASSVDDSIKHAIDFEISENTLIAKLSIFNEVLLHFPDSGVELERFDLKLILKLILKTTRTLLKIKYQI